MNKVFFQDAAWLMLMDDGESGADLRHEHPMFDEVPALKSPLFLEFKNCMKEAIDNEKCPLDASLEKVIPGLHQWHHENHTALKLLDSKVTRESKAMSEAMDEGFQLLQESIKEERHDPEEALYKLFTDLADALSPNKRRRVAEGTNSVSKGVNDREDAAIANFRQHLARLSNSNSNPSPTNGNDEPWLAPVHRDFRMASKHDSLLDLHNEWCGLDRCLDEEWKGVSGREQEFGKKWRRHINNNHFSRTKRVVQAIELRQEQLGADATPADACPDHQPTFMGGNRSVAKMVVALQGMALLPKAKPRGKRKNDSESD